MKEKVKKIKVQEKYDRIMQHYTNASQYYTTLSRGVATTARDEEMRDIQGDLLEYVDALGYLLEKGSFPYGREVARMLFTVPDYTPPAHVLEVAARGVALALRTGQLSLTLEDVKVEDN